MEPIELLRTKKRELEAQIAEITRLIRAYEDIQRQMMSVLGSEPPKVVVQLKMPPTPRAEKQEPPSRAKSPDVRAFEAAVSEILESAIRPLNRHELLDSLTNRGVLVGGADPINTLGARLFRMDGVSGIRGVGYFLTRRSNEFHPKNGAGEEEEVAIKMPEIDKMPEFGPSLP